MGSVFPLGLRGVSPLLLLLAIRLLWCRAGRRPHDAGGAVARASGNRHPLPRRAMGTRRTAPLPHAGHAGKTYACPWAWLSAGSPRPLDPEIPPRRARSPPLSPSLVLFAPKISRWSTSTGGWSPTVASGTPRQAAPAAASPTRARSPAAATHPAHEDAISQRVWLWDWAQPAALKRVSEGRSLSVCWHTAL
eukprot:scaffold33373_cov124-Isochrysis_galbana.AAC.2